MSLSRALGAVAVLLLTTGELSARPQALTSAQLQQGADRTVTGRVISIESRWNHNRTGLWTTIALQPSIGGEPIVIDQPGGELDGARHIIVGMPSFTVGELVRVHLRRTAGESYRVYGWAQGKTTLEFGAGATMPFAPNGFVWQPNQIPVQFLFHQDGSDDVPYAAARAAVLRAFDSWESVPCATLTFADMGDTDIAPAVDDFQVVTWIESGWIFGEEAAGATSLFIHPTDPPTADIALNGEHYSWADGVPSVGPATQDIQGVMAHEIGHFNGLSHTMKSIDTMYFSWTPWQSQRSLSADDKLGLCSIYPAPAVAHECDGDLECDDGAICETFASGRLCSPQPDPIGADCGNNRVECDGFCLFNSFNLTSGYCSRFCDELACPPGFECNDASAGAEPVRVCFRAAPCTGDESCPDGRYCGADQICTFDCRESIDCAADEACDIEGRCVAMPVDDGGCGCKSSGTPAGPALFCLLGLLIWFRRDRSRAS